MSINEFFDSFKCLRSIYFIMIKDTEGYLFEEIDFLLKMLSKMKDGRLVLASGEVDLVKSQIHKLYARLNKEQHSIWLRKFRKNLKGREVGERLWGLMVFVIVRFLCVTYEECDQGRWIR